jgi:hypothetical protein
MSEGFEGKWEQVRSIVGQSAKAWLPGVDYLIERPQW